MDTTRTQADTTELEADTTGLGQAAAPMDPLVAQARLERLDQVERLLAVYRRIPGLREVRIGVEGGVLELRGTVLSSEDRERALGYARALVTGVDFVDDRGLLVETDVRRRLEPAYDRIREKGVAFLRFLPTLLLGLVVLGLGGGLAWWLGNRHGIYERFGRNPFAQNLLRQVVRFAVFLVALLLALDLMAITALVGAVLGAAGVAGIAVGFAFRDIVENYLAGVLLSLRQPFAPQDHVQLAGEEGRVIRLTGRETVLMTLDGNHVRIPNATVFKAVITNLSRNPRRRFHFMATVAPWEALGPVIQVTRAAVRSVEGVMETPAVAVRVSELQDSAVALRVSGWVDQTRSDFGKVRSRAIRAVKEAYEAAGIDTPPPEYGIRILGDDTAGDPFDPDAAAESGDAPREPAVSPSAKAGGQRVAHRTERPELPSPAPATPAPPGGDDAPEEDTSPDLTIEEEIARELAVSDEENLLAPSRPEAEGGRTRILPEAAGEG